MKKVFQQIFTITLLIFLISCGRQIDCPGFDESLLEWTPYQEGDTINLTNFSNELKLVINQITIEHTTHYMTNLDCGTCDDQILINSNETDSPDLEIIIGLNENNLINQNYLIKGVYFSESQTDYSEHSDYLFEGITYEEVRIFERNERDENYYKLVVAKGFGIIALFDINENIWKLKSETLKSYENETIEILNISCE